jgi:hypothetical protein
MRALLWPLVLLLSVASARPEVEPYREIGYAPMGDGVKLAYVVYRPAREGRFPVVLRYDAYDTGGMAVSSWVSDFVSHGYAVVGANVRGSGCSAGSTFSVLQPQEAPDGAGLIEWIGVQPWSNGRVGMFGNSYPGHTQIVVGAERPRFLKALAAGGLTADLYTDAFRPGGIFNVSFAAFWGLKAQPWAARNGAEARIKWGDSECREIRARQPANRVFYEVRDHPLRDEYWKARATESRAHLVQTPTLIIQGWQDQQTAMGGPRLFQRLGGPKKMILTNGGHGAYNMAISRAQILRWMDRWLKDEPNGVDREPPVTVWFETRVVDDQPKPGWVAGFSDWPVPEVQWSELYLTADGRLHRERPTKEGSGNRSYIFPVGTELVGDNQVFANPPAPLGSLTYRTGALEEDTTVLGSAQLTFYCSAEQRDTDFMVASTTLTLGGTPRSSRGPFCGHRIGPSTLRSRPRTMSFTRTTGPRS